MKIKAEVVKIPAIEEFLAQWKERVRAYYMESRQEYLKMHNEYYANKGTKHDTDAYIQYRNNLVKKFGKGTLSLVSDGYKLEERIEKLLSAEVESKRAWFIGRVEAKAGKIKDAACLSIGLNGEINGVVHGEIGTVTVETIGAGGYNIQCFHFRVLVKLR